MRQSSKQYIELIISCAELKPPESNKDLLKINPQIAIYTKCDNQTELLGKTETVKNDCNPIFSTTVKVDFYLN